MQNAWLQAHLGTIDRMAKMLVEMEYLPIFQDYPVKTIQSLFKGATAEISRLQNENETLKNEVRKLTPKPDENPETPTPKVAPKAAPKKGKQGAPSA